MQTLLILWPRRAEFLINSLLILLVLCLSLAGQVFAAGLDISPVKDPIAELNSRYPNASKITDKTGELGIRTIEKGDEILAYAFETNDIAPVPAYSGEPVNVLVVMDSKGHIQHSVVLEHHEPILLVGIPVQKLFDFVGQYVGLHASTKVRLGGSQAEKENEHSASIDAVSGATVTVMVINVAIMRSVAKVAKHLGIVAQTGDIRQGTASIRSDVFEIADWPQLLQSGAMGRLHLRQGEVDQAFVGTSAEHEGTSDPAADFADIYYAHLNVPSIGKNLLGESEYQWLVSELKENEHAIILLGNGYSFKGSGYVRGGIFDRVVVHQGDNEISFRDIDHYRVNDIYINGAPDFDEMSLFIVRDFHEFDPGLQWQLELLVRRQVGAIDSMFASFKSDYLLPEHYVDQPPVISPEEPKAAHVLVWEERKTTITIVIASMVLIILVMFFQDWLVKFPKQLHLFRHIFLLYTIFFIGWYAMGQLSIVNVFTFMQALMRDFQWETFLLDPVIFLLWVFVAFSVLLWGRGIYCGWLCPFGALQDLINEIALKLKIPQYVVPWHIHERLWAVKYIILLGLFGLSLESLSTAETYAEVEPFKTTFLLRFDRTWPFVTYAGLLLLTSIFSRKIYCRYLCPLGAAIAIPSGIRLFNWLKRRRECGDPCRVCANECEIGAIELDGEINLRECHHCLDCQMTYYNQEKCPPLINKNKSRSKLKNKTKDEPVVFVDA